MIKHAQRSERAGGRQRIHMRESPRGAEQIKVVPATLDHARAGANVSKEDAWSISAGLLARPRIRVLGSVYKYLKISKEGLQAKSRHGNPLCAVFWRLSERRGHTRYPPFDLRLQLARALWAETYLVDGEVAR